MATKVGEIEVAVVAKLDKLERDLSRMQKKLDGAALAANKPLARMKQAFASLGKSGAAQLGALTASFIGITKVMRDMIQSAEEDELAFTRLEAALARVTPNATDAAASLYAQADAFDRISTSSSTAILNAQTFLTNMGVMPDQMEKAVSASLNMAAALGWDLTSAARNAGKTLGGFAGELGEVIPELKDLTTEELQAGDALDILIAKFGGQFEAQMGTFAGRTKELSDSWGAFTSNIGKVITKSPQLASALDDVSESLRDMDNASSVVTGLRNAYMALSFASGLIDDALEGAADSAIWLSDKLSFLPGNSGIHTSMLLLEQAAEQQRIFIEKQEESLRIERELLDVLGMPHRASPAYPDRPPLRKVPKPRFNSEELKEQAKFLNALEVEWNKHHENLKRLSELRRNQEMIEAHDTLEGTIELKAALLQIEEMHRKRVSEIEEESAKESISLRESMHEKILSLNGDEAAIAEEDHRKRLKQIEELNVADAERAQLRIQSEGLLQVELGNIIEEEIANQKDAWEGFYDFITDGFESALADMVISGEVSFKKLGDAFLREFVQRAIAAIVGNQLENVLGSLGDFLGLASGMDWTAQPGTVAAFKPPPIQLDIELPYQGGNPATGWANGGPMRSGKVGLVGERGPELFVPQTSGMIVPNEKMGLVGGGDVYVSVVNNSGEKSETRESTNADGTRQIEVMIGKTVASNIARGGTIDGAIRGSYGLKRTGSHR